MVGLSLALRFRICFIRRANMVWWFTAWVRANPPKAAEAAMWGPRIFFMPVATIAPRLTSIPAWTMM